MVRDKYLRRQAYGISVKNEPYCCIDLTNIDLNICEYPDMHLAYHKAREILAIPTEFDFILGNGCEAVLKSILLALSKSNIYYSIPNWGMIGVLAQQLNIHEQIGRYNFSECDNSLYEQKTGYVSDCVRYCAFKSNNYYATNIELDKSIITIIDCSYVNPLDLSEVYALLRQSENFIAIGGFQKSFGCGIRLGYAIFNLKFSNRIQMCRENYLNYIAYSILSQYEKIDFIKCIMKNKAYWSDIISRIHINKLYYYNNSFITMLRNDLPDFPHKKFTVGNQTFIRIGTITDTSYQIKMYDYMNKY